MEYYRAAHIALLIAASHLQDPMAWAELERCHAWGLPLPILAWLLKNHRPKASELLPTTTLTLSKWDNYRKKRGATALLSASASTGDTPTANPRFQSQNLAEAWYNYNMANNARRLPPTTPRSLHRIQATQHGDFLLHPTAIMDKSPNDTTNSKDT
ncbi:Hypothetical predicted protein [Pelobates cultripes]|uniref:Uncharacterized protein n=1 Tax=Pelobates cultripes TaxID=61616 RepID=A0AAD1REH8_PELCU|nr:Hypothetical predicted protein [Pelobates cultripes]